MLSIVEMPEYLRDSDNIFVLPFTCSNPELPDRAYLRNASIGEHYLEGAYHIFCEGNLEFEGPKLECSFPDGWSGSTGSCVFNEVS